MARKRQPLCNDAVRVKLDKVALQKVADHQSEKRVKNMQHLAECIPAAATMCTSELIYGDTKVDACDLCMLADFSSVS